MLPAAPVRVSTTAAFPQRWVSLCAMSRARMSTPPPGAKPTSSRTVFAGYCAAAGSEGTTSRAASRACKSCFISLRLRHGPADQRVAREEGGELVFAPAFGAGRPHRHDDVAHVRGGVGDADGHRSGNHGAEFL